MTDARAMLDCGSSHCFINRTIAESLGNAVRWSYPKRKLRVNLPDGKTIATSQRGKVFMQLGRWTGQIQAWVLDIPNYEVVLGLDFLRQYNPRVDWPTSTMSLPWRGRWERVRAENGGAVRIDNGAELNVISQHQAARISRKKGSESILCMVREKKEEVKNPDGLSHKDPRIEALLQKFSTVFPKELPKQLPPDRWIAHGIDTADASPVNINAYPLSQEKLEEQAEQVEELLDKGLIRPSASPWGFPVVFVRKSDGKWRMCIDYRALNAVTKKNGYPLPRIQELLTIIGRAKCLSKIDLVSGYWQVRLKPEDTSKSAFNTIWGKYEWLAMPFGLCNAPATFQTLMNETLRTKLGHTVIVYLDDILIFSNSPDDHYRDLEEVLRALQDQKLYARLPKCTFMAPQVDFCGHTIGSGTVKPMQEKIDIIASWPRPTNVQEVRQWIGLTGFYRQFVRGFANIATPLHELLKEGDIELRKKKRRPIVWTRDCEASFANLKEILVAKPVLAQPDPKQPFTIETDASEWAIGYVLMQKGEDNKLHPVAFDGRKLRDAELNYPTQEKELLAIKEALRTWDRHIENGTTTTVLTDHHSLRYLSTTKTYSKRLARWVEEFQAYNLDIRYRKGSDAIVPDALSRRPDFMGEGPANVAQNQPTARFNAMVGSHTEEDWHNATIHFLRQGVRANEKSLQNRVDAFASHLTLRTIPEPMQLSSEPQELFYTYDDDVSAMYHDEHSRVGLVRRLHEEFGHLGYPGLLGVLRPRAWWPSMRKEVEDAIKTCPNCQVSQGSKENLRREEAQFLARTDIQPFDRWGIDLIGRLPTTPHGNRWIITAIDYATGWTIAKAIPEATEEAIAKFLHDDLFTQYGAPREFLTDNGANLLSASVRYYVTLIQARHRVTTPAHPQTNGKNENFNGLLGRILTKYLMGKPTRLWDEYLLQALFATRIRQHTATGMSPFYLLYGIQPRIPSDPDSPTIPTEDRLQKVTHARARANELLLARAIRAKTVRDSLVTKPTFQPGKWVLVRNESHQKYESRWFGPYLILKSHPLGTYALQEPGGRVLRNLINGNRLVEAHVDEPTSLWTSSAGQKRLKRAGFTIHHPEEVRKVMDAIDPNPVSYHEMSTISKRKWLEMERTGVRSRLVGEGDDDALGERCAGDSEDPELVRTSSDPVRTSESARTAEVGDSAASPRTSPTADSDQLDDPEENGHRENASSPDTVMEDAPREDSDNDAPYSFRRPRRYKGRQRLQSP
jgi:transposase InsO family protein